jgi:lipopolysaccharide/colanic/teichoic acid biosynthesis glycosyltransferase
MNAPFPSTLCTTRPSPSGADTVALRSNTSLRGTMARPAAGFGIRRTAPARAVAAGDLVSPRAAANPHPVPLTPAQRRLKRALDLLGALCLLVLTAPLILLAALLIRLTSPGPAFYTQTRVGKDGREFPLLKLRTMIAGAEARTGPVLALAGDPRITAIGRILRALRLDELPQLVNVLRGEMSLIGPRPERPHFVDLYRRVLPGYDLRLAVRPGITGLAQTSCRYSTAPALKLHFDLRYIESCTLALDARIAFRTILTVLQPSRAEGVAAPASQDSN